MDAFQGLASFGHKAASHPQQLTRLSVEWPLNTTRAVQKQEQLKKQQQEAKRHPNIGPLTMPWNTFILVFFSISSSIVSP